MATKSTTTFADAIALCGLSQAEAAYFLDVKLPRMQKWSRGAIECPDWAIDRLAELWLSISGERADQALPEGSALRRQTVSILRTRIPVTT
ncbi:hypothetical protein [Aureimonas sp. Leaf324]|uniref:hypothetical protein n=1 Tax=Aureimonas sp. Leaf324 TaxID=1736336 RepID=UPI0006F1F1D7|nr:hypothetical protein [Aureimonas sp. Leaf324]KQQ90975.1 hypothetical protein ASF65_00070 [Aureimonas sp. Leaf324]